MTRVLSLLAAVVTAAAAIALLLLAFDVRRWQEAIAEGDARYRTASAAVEVWDADTIVPGDPAVRLLGVADDVRYRRAVRAFLAAKPGDPRLALPEVHAARIEAHVELRELVQVERNAQRRSHLANLLGALTAAVGAEQDATRRGNAYGSAAGYFVEAIRYDPSNEEAKFNLESVLRQLREQPRSYESPGGRTPQDEASMGGLRDAGSGY